MICPKCGANVTTDAAFCQKCGARMNGTAAENDHRPAENAFSPAMEKQLSGRGTADIPEEALWEGGVSPKAMVREWALAGLATIGLVTVSVLLANRDVGQWPLALLAIPLVWGAVGLRYGYLRLAIHYRLTNQRFFHERGLLRRVVDRIEVVDISDVASEQGLIDRFLGTGTILIESNDRTHPHLRLSGIDEVHRVASLFDKARRAERVRRGVIIEQAASG